MMKTMGTADDEAVRTAGSTAMRRTAAAAQLQRALGEEAAALDASMTAFCSWTATATALAALHLGGAAAAAMGALQPSLLLQLLTTRMSAAVAVQALQARDDWRRFAASIVLATMLRRKRTLPLQPLPGTCTSMTGRTRVPTAAGLQLALQHPLPPQLRRRVQM